MTKLTKSILNSIDNYTKNMIGGKTHSRELIAEVRIDMDTKKGASGFAAGQWPTKIDERFAANKFKL